MDIGNHHLCKNLEHSKSKGDSMLIKLAKYNEEAKVANGIKSKAHNDY